MCGITGFYDLGASESMITPILKKMTDIITHRGPDDYGYFITNNVGLGMRRLSIIDVDGGKQPIFNESGNKVIIYNGEIYNYKDLQEYLLIRGHNLRTSSDTEVIIHLYEEFGYDCMQKLRGMFAFAIWDSDKKSLFIARDRLGIKPLYYSIIDKKIIFSSEIKSILQHPSIQPSLCIEALNNFLTFKYIPAPQTLFNNIYSLSPGHFLIFDENGVIVKQYWDLSFINNESPINLHEEDYIEQLRTILEESVQIHLMSDVPFGAFLSGGLDSSTIVALMSKFLTKQVKTFSIGYQGSGANVSELSYARLIAEQYKTDHHEVIIQGKDLVDNIESMCWHLDQPIADQANIATYLLSRYTSNFVKMVLTGEGGDELFAGYARYSGEKFSPLFSLIPNNIKRWIINQSERLPRLRRQKIALVALCQEDESSRFTYWFPLMNYYQKIRLLSDSFIESVNDPTSTSIISTLLSKADAKDSLSKMLYLDTKLWLPDDLLARGDKMSMSSSLEMRVPLLDHELVEFAASIPSKLKVKNFNSKYLLKQASRSLLPNEIVNRKKQGFSIPFNEWLREEAKPLMLDILTPASINKRGIFKPSVVQTYINQHLTRFADNATIILALINIELWFRRYID